MHSRERVSCRNAVAFANNDVIIIAQRVAVDRRQSRSACDRFLTGAPAAIARPRQPAYAVKRSTSGNSYSASLYPDHGTSKGSH